MIFNPVIFGASASGLLYIYVAQLPDKVEYYTGENFDPTGMIVKGVNEDLTEVVVPNDQLSYIPPMPLRVGSELLKLIYTEGGRSYGTTLALSIMLGISGTDVFTPIDIETVELVELVDIMLTEAQAPISLTFSDTIAPITIDDAVVESMESYIGAGPYDPTPIVPKIRRAIVTFDVSQNDYVIENNNQIVLQSEYDYVSTPQTIDSGANCKLIVPTSDKSGISELTLTSEVYHGI